MSSIQFSPRTVRINDVVAPAFSKAVMTPLIPLLFAKSMGEYLFQPQMR